MRMYRILIVLRELVGRVAALLVLLLVGCGRVAQEVRRRIGGTE